MTAKDTTDRTGEAIDFTMMHATHDAFRRDLARLAAASAAGTAHAPGVRAGWENFNAQLLLHHSVEDTDLWPRVRRAAAGRPAGHALLEEMAAEHAQIDPLLAAAPGVSRSTLLWHPCGPPLSRGHKFLARWLI
jgi:hypothetical protein